MVKKKKYKKALSQKDALLNQVLGIFTNNPTRNYNYKQISGQLGVKDSGTRKVISEIILELKDK